MTRATDKARTEIVYDQQASAVLLSIMAVRGVSYSKLAAKLREKGIEIGARSLEDKISAGGFSASFMIQCMHILCANSSDIG